MEKNFDQKFSIFFDEIFLKPYLLIEEDAENTILDNFTHSKNFKHVEKMLFSMGVFGQFYGSFWTIGKSPISAYNGSELHELKRFETSSFYAEYGKVFYRQSPA